MVVAVAADAGDPKALRDLSLAYGSLKRIYEYVQIKHRSISVAVIQKAPTGQVLSHDGFHVVRQYQQSW